MLLRIFGRIPWRPARWGLFFVLLGTLATGLYVLLPPEPRWVLQTGPRGVFDACDGCFATFSTAEGKACGPLLLWDASTGQEVARFLTDEPFHTHAYGEDGRSFVAICKGDRPDLWSIRGVDLAARRPWHADVIVHGVTSDSFAPLGNVVALRRMVNENEGYHVIVDTSTGRAVVELPSDTDQFHFSRNGACMVAAYRDADEKRRLCVADTRTAKTSVIENANLVAVSPDARWIIADRGAEGEWLWDRDRSRWHVRLTETKKPRDIVLEQHIMHDHELVTYFATVRYALRSVRKRGGVALWADGSVRRGHLRLWDFSISAEGGHIFSPDSRCVLVMSSGDTGQTQWTLHEVATGKPLWKRSWEQNPIGPIFTPDSCRIIVKVPNARSVDVVDATTGASTHSHSCEGLENVSGQLTRDGRTVVIIGSPPDEEPHWLLAKIEDWVLPASDAAPMLVRAYDVETGALVGELRTDEADVPWLTDDRQSLITVNNERNDQGPVATTIRCWDMPPRKPLRWVLGVPLALGLALVAVRIGWRRLRRRRPDAGKATDWSATVGQDSNPVRLAGGQDWNPVLR